MVLNISLEQIKSILVDDFVKNNRINKESMKVFFEQSISNNNLDDFKITLKALLDTRTSKKLCTVKDYNLLMIKQLIYNKLCYLINSSTVVSEMSPSFKIVNSNRCKNRIELDNIIIKLNEKVMQPKQKVIGKINKHY